MLAPMRGEGAAALRRELVVVVAPFRCRPSAVGLGVRRLPPSPLTAVWFLGEDLAAPVRSRFRSRSRSRSRAVVLRLRAVVAAMGTAAAGFLLAGTAEGEVLAGAREALAMALREGMVFFEERGVKEVESEGVGGGRGGDEGSTGGRARVWAGGRRGFCHESEEAERSVDGMAEESERSVWYGGVERVGEKCLLGKTRPRPLSDFVCVAVT